MWNTLRFNNTNYDIHSRHGQYLLQKYIQRGGRRRPTKRQRELKKILSSMAKENEAQNVKTLKMLRKYFGPRGGLAASRYFNRVRAQDAKLQEIELEDDDM